jgi:preprotein translocase subunit SecD
VKTRQRRPDGTFYDTVTRRIPLRRGLDLSGGMHLALEVDESKGVIANKGDAIDRALKVVRTRIEGMGVSETVIQKLATIASSSTFPGVDDRERAISMVQGQAFLQFQITDKTQALEKVLPRLRRHRQADWFRRMSPPTGGKSPEKPADGGLGGLLTTGTDTRQAAGQARRRTAAKTDSASIPVSPAASSPRCILCWPDARQFLVRRRPLRCAEEVSSEAPEVVAALPPARYLRFGSDSTVGADKVYRFLYCSTAIRSSPVSTSPMRKPNSSALEGTVVEFTLSNEGGRIFGREDGEAPQGLHGDRARRHRHGLSADHQWRDPDAWPDHHGSGP